MDNTEKQKFLSSIANDIRKMVIREIHNYEKRSNTKIPSYNSIMSNALPNADSVYSDLNFAPNQKIFTNDNVYKRMKNNIQTKNSHSSYLNKGTSKIRKEVKL